MLRACSTFGICLALTACAATRDEPAAENAAIKKDIAAEIERICGLPEPERAAELAALRRRSGYELQCGH